MSSTDAVFAKGGKEGHVRALSDMLGQRKVPESFKPAYWEVVDVSPAKLILGDACAIAVSSGGEPGSLLSFGASAINPYVAFETIQSNPS